MISGGRVYSDEFVWVDGGFGRWDEIYVAVWLKMEAEVVEDGGFERGDE